MGPGHKPSSEGPCAEVNAATSAETYGCNREALQGLASGLGKRPVLSVLCVLSPQKNDLCELGPPVSVPPSARFPEAWVAALARRAGWAEGRCLQEAPAGCWLLHVKCARAAVDAGQLRRNADGGQVVRGRQAVWGMLA